MNALPPLLHTPYYPKGTAPLPYFKGLNNLSIEL